MIGKFHIPYGLSNPDPATYCPTNGYIDPTQPNENWLILPKANSKYGLLYNWYAATDSRNICSIGWHIPTYTEGGILVNYLGGTTIAGGKLKETGLIYWTSPNLGATNESLFNARGAGLRNNAGYTNLNSTMAFWNTNGVGSDGYFTGNISNGTTGCNYTSGMTKWYGLSLRPVKDSTTLSNGQIGIYIDPSGYAYPTICIGTQEWVACNIKTKHYRTGVAIPEVTDNTAWAALTTGALCAFNNDWNNV